MIRALVRSLNRLGVDYAITGAIAASYYGAPRTTIDLDVLVHASSDNMDKLRKALQRSRIDADAQALKEASRLGAFNLVRCNDTLSPHTVDIIRRRHKFRKLSGRALGMKTYYQPPEELIRMKLRMIKATKPPERATKDIDDVHSILNNTRVNLTRIKLYAKLDTTFEIFHSISKRTAQHREHWRERCKDTASSSASSRRRKNA